MSVEASDDPIIRAGREGVESSRRFIDSETIKHLGWALLIVLLGGVGVYFSLHWLAYGAGVVALLYALLVLISSAEDHKDMDLIEENLGILSQLDKE